MAAWDLGGKREVIYNQKSSFFYFSDPEGDNTNTISVLKEMDLLDQCTDEDISITREICDIISQRGAYIVATGLYKHQ